MRKRNKERQKLRERSREYCKSFLRVNCRIFGVIVDLFKRLITSIVTFLRKWDVQMEIEEPNLIMIYLDGMKEWEIQKYMNERIKKGWMNEWAIDMN